MEKGVPLTDTGYLAGIGDRELRRIFAGRGTIPLFGERLANLREAGQMLMEHWAGDAVNLVEAAQHSAVRLVHLVTTTFPGFRDQAGYLGRPVVFWKRAQIFAADLAAAFEGAMWGRFDDLHRLTAFADYKLPQVLRELGLIEYRRDLAEKVDRLDLLEPGGEEEVEIRAATIEAVERLKDEFAAAGRPVTSTEVDNWLWQLGQLEPFRRRPYHRCRTIFY
jgi:hypothetical protein